MFTLQPRYAGDLADIMPTLIGNLDDVSKALTGAIRTLQSRSDEALLSSLTGQMLWQVVSGDFLPCAVVIMQIYARMSGPQNKDIVVLQACASYLHDLMMMMMISLILKRIAASSHQLFCSVDGLAYLQDAAVTLAAFMEAYPPAAGVVMVCSGDGLLNLITSLHDGLAVPLLKFSTGQEPADKVCSSLQCSIVVREHCALPPMRLSKFKHKVILSELWCFCACLPSRGGGSRWD